jgi:predicted phosphodiesterase
MKTLIISDLHLTTQFDPKKFMFLQEIIESADQVIINGDFWEGLLLQFNDFVNSDWRKLFPLLKAKKTIYIYGNHDKKYLCDDRVNLFSVEQKNYHRLQIGNLVFVIVHGHQFNPFFNRLLHPIKLPQFFLKVLMAQERWLVTTFKNSYIQFHYRLYNKEIKAKINSNLRKNEILVCAHTHAAELDTDNKYINTGLIDHGLAQYLMIDDEEIQLHSVHYF